MNDENLFRALYFAALALTCAFRLTQHFRASTHRDRFSSPAEGRGIAVLRLIFIPSFFLLLVCYAAWPDLLSWAAVLFPIWLRWVGVALLFGAFVPLVWVHRALDRNFSGTLRLRDDHTMVTWGPYRWVRHPMYTVFVIMFVGNLFVTANLLLGFVPLVAFGIIMVWRTPREEAQLAERFGRAYTEYCERTGRFLPRLWQRRPRTGVA